MKSFKIFIAIIMAILVIISPMFKDYCFIAVAVLNITLYLIYAFKDEVENALFNTTIVAGSILIQWAGVFFIPSLEGCSYHPAWLLTQIITAFIAMLWNCVYHCQKEQ